MAIIIGSQEEEESSLVWKSQTMMVSPRPTCKYVSLAGRVTRGKALGDPLPCGPLHFRHSNETTKSGKFNIDQGKPYVVIRPASSPVVVRGAI